MKKLLILLSIPFIFILTAKASSYEIRWENTYVDVLIDDDINNYKEVPVARLYADGLLVDTFVGYNRYYNNTSIDIVSTEVVGEYFVYYEATFSDYGLKSVEVITFNVYDPTFPEFNIESDIYIEYQESFDFSTIKCEDAIDGSLDFTYIGEVDFNTLGDYIVVFYATDSSNNKTVYEVTFHIVDVIKPEIYVLDNYIDIGEKIDISKLIEVYDDCDNNMPKPLIIHNIDFNKIGEYEACIYVKDSSDNYNILRETFYVVDRVKPKISLTCDRVKIYVDQELNLKDYILSVSDNYCQIDKEKVNITTNYKNEIGLYEAIYSIYDDYGNFGINRIIIEVLDKMPPVINAYNKTINLYDDFDKYKDVSAYDNLDLDISYRLLCNSEVDTAKPGVYELTYSVYDSSNNYTYKTIYVNVLDDKKNNTISFPNYVENEYFGDGENVEIVENKKSFKAYYLIIPLSLVGIALVSIIIKKRRRKK